MGGFGEKGGIREYFRKGTAFELEYSHVLPGGQRRELVQRRQHKLRPDCVKVCGILSKN